MSKYHETIKNVKKSPKKSAKEKRMEKEEKRVIKTASSDIKKIIEEKNK